EEYAGGVVRPVPAPDHHGLAENRDGHRGILLVPGSGRVDAEFTIDLAAVGGRDNLAVYTPAAAILAVALPGNDDVAAGVHRCGRGRLIARGGGVDLGLATHAIAVPVVALAVDAPTVRRVLPK